MAGPHVILLSQEEKHPAHRMTGQHPTYRRHQEVPAAR